MEVVARCVLKGVNACFPASQSVLSSSYQTDGSCKGALTLRRSEFWAPHGEWMPHALDAQTSPSQRGRNPSGRRCSVRATWIDSRSSSASPQPTLASNVAAEVLSPSPVIAPRSLSPFVECLEVNGSSQLEGHVRISGAKNSALAVLAGALCCEEPIVLRMIPDLHDIKRMRQVLQSVGAKAERGVDGLYSSLLIDASHLTSVEPCPDTVRKLRASFFVLGPLLARQGKAIVPLPGGCNIGARPINLHVQGLQDLGAHVEVKQGKVYAEVPKGGRLVGGTVRMDYPSVGATETLMMAAVLADGESTIHNVAQDPEVVDLANFLNLCGAKILGAGTRTLCIMGVKKLHAADFTIIPDRIEAGTFLAASAMTKSAISLSPVIPAHLAAVIEKLKRMGCQIWTEPGRPDTLRVKAPEELSARTKVETGPFPAFPTDMQPQLMALLTQCSGGQHMIKETVFESRMRHAEELQKMGANLSVTGSIALLERSPLYGVPVTATDLRAGAALVLAGMVAEGTTHISGLHHIDRGYERLDEKLRGLGANIKRVPCLPEELLDC